jgi:predicted AAA+ superfamily ATPase
MTALLENLIHITLLKQLVKNNTDQKSFIVKTNQQDKETDFIIISVSK